jgi:hypothetical protein
MAERLKNQENCVFFVSAKDSEPFLSPVHVEGRSNSPDIYEKLHTSFEQLARFKHTAKNVVKNCIFCFVFISTQNRIRDMITMKLKSRKQKTCRRF